VTNEDRGGKARRGARREGRGLVSVLLGTALLAVLGFGLGIVAGLVLEEPGLLLDYVTGKTSPAPLIATRSANEFAASEREKKRVAEVAPAAAQPTAEALHASIPDVAAAPREFEAAAGADETPNGAVEIDAGEAAAKTPPQVAAAPPSAPSPKPVSPAAIAAEPTPDSDASPAAPLVPAVPPAGRGYSVQVGALADAASAEQLAVKLRKRGFPVYVAPSAEPGSKRWRVRVGPVASREQADELATTLAREKLPTWILAEGPR
jgi:DedD protein